MIAFGRLRRSRRHRPERRRRRRRLLPPACLSDRPSVRSSPTDRPRERASERAALAVYRSSVAVALSSSSAATKAAAAAVAAAGTRTESVRPTVQRSPLVVPRSAEDCMGPRRGAGPANGQRRHCSVVVVTLRKRGLGGGGPREDGHRQGLQCPVGGRGGGLARTCFVLAAVWLAVLSDLSHSVPSKFHALCIEMEMIRSDE